MKKEFDIDLLHPKNVGVGLDGNYYMIILNGVVQRVIKIDTQTGKLISDETLPYEK